MSSSTSAGRSLRTTRRGPVAPAPATKEPKTPRTATAGKDTTDADAPTNVQELKDSIKELEDTKTQLESKVTQLEYLEANARLSASMLSKEIMDLKEKSRKLEIELSTVVDERDSLEQEKDQLIKQVEDIKDKDEARQLSTKLKDAWIKLSTLSAEKKDYVQRLFKSEDINAKLNADMTKAADLHDATKDAHTEEKRQWEAERREHIAEIESLKEKLAQSSNDGSKQIIDWEEDKARLRNGFKQERSIWDKEKKGFLDQIASYKVKATALSVKKTAPPEWILEKDQLLEKCTTLQSRITSLEDDRANSVAGLEGLKKVEAEKQKLEKKVETLKAKLVEVLHSAAALQDNKKPSQSQRSRSTPRRKSRSVAMNSDSDSDSDGAGTIVQDQDEGAKGAKSSHAKPPPRATRAKRTTTSVKRVNYRLSSDEGEESEGNDTDDEDEDDQQEGATEDGDDGEQEQSASKDEDVEMEQVAATKGKETISGAKRTRSKDAADQEVDSPQPLSTARSKRGATGKPRNPDSDSEFEPPVKTTLKAKGRGKGNDKKAASPAVEPAPKRPAAVESSYGSTSTASPGIPSTTSTAASTPTSITDGASATSTGSTKIKKKRKLLTGKGLEELGDILNGPGSSLSSGPSTGLVFSKGNTRPRINSGAASVESSMLNGAGPSAVSLDALNAIKMTFTIPKPRNPSPG